MLTDAAPDAAVLPTGLDALPDVIVDVVVSGRLGRWDVVLRRGHIAEVVTHSCGRAWGRGKRVLDGAGRLLAPGFVDSHVHLDKAFQLTQLDLPDGVSGLDAALQATARLRSQLGEDDVYRSAERLVQSLFAQGTVGARVHIEVGSKTTGLVELHQLLAQSHPEVELQLCAFPQHGTSASKGEDDLTRALDAGCQVVGGCPYADPDPLRHLEFVASLARDRELPLDLHLDLSDSPRDSLIDPALDAVERHGLGGRTVFGHMTTLTAMRSAEARERIARMTQLGVSVVAIPTTDLFLSGRGDDHAPTRGVTRVRQLWDQGTSVMLGSNNHENAFTPVSGGGLLRVAWLAALAGHFGTDADHTALFDAITTVPARVLGLSSPPVVPGSAVKHVLLDSSGPGDAVRKAPHPAAVLTVAGMYLPTGAEHRTT